MRLLSFQHDKTLDVSRLYTHIIGCALQTNASPIYLKIHHGQLLGT